MTQLLQQFTISQILIFTIGLLLAIKGAWDLVDYFRKKYQEKFNKDYSKLKQVETLERHYQECKNQHKETLDIYDKLDNKLDTLSESIENKFDAVDEKFDDLNKRIDQLDENDKHAIKQTIVKDYHYFVEKVGKIDDFSLDSILLLYEDYKKLGGNSYVGGLVEELKRLPKQTL